MTMSENPIQGRANKRMPRNLIIQELLEYEVEAKTEDVCEACSSLDCNECTSTD